MSAITIISGLPGNGKTLLAVKMMREYKAEGRLVLAKNFAGLDPSIAQDWPHPMEEWKTIPPGAVLFVDESQDFVATQGKGGSPAWVTDFSKVRHGGLELVFVTQDPRFLDPWVRRLCNRHIHVMRKMGMQVAVLHEWDRVQENPVDYHALQASQKTTWKYPKELFSLYKSATIHTVKRRIPKKVYFLFFALAATIGLVWYASQRVLRPPGTVAEGGPAGTSGRPAAVVSAADYAKRFTPVVQSMPWSAPAYADLKPTDFPVLYCMISEEKGCRCYTQQITRYYIDENICRVIVRDGVFNPFASQRKDVERDRDRGRSDDGDLMPEPDRRRRRARRDDPVDWQSSSSIGESLGGFVGPGDFRGQAGGFRTPVSRSSALIPDAPPSN